MRIMSCYDGHGGRMAVFLLCVSLLVAPVGLNAQHVQNAQNVQDVQDFPYETGWLRSLSNPVATNGFWDNWYVDFGVDMNLLFPYQHNYKDVFPNGKSFGINAAAGKWFSPEFGGRLKFTWNNGILKNDHNTWLSPYGVPGGNHEKGGFLTFIGDIRFNLHNILGTYQADRLWNFVFAPRAGGWIDFGTGSGAHVLGVGFINTFRINDEWSLFADAGYHFVSSVNGVRSGTGHGSNGFAEISIGIERNLGYPKFNKASEYPVRYSQAVATNSLWDNWFVQTGLCMSLQNPYSTNFIHVFPNGNTVGLDLSLGKWFTPEVGVRGGLNWQNGIIPNRKASYLDPVDKPGGNFEKHGFIAIYADALVNLHNIILGYDDSRKWNAIVFPRMGFCDNLSANYKENPIVGIGTEFTFAVNQKYKIYSDVVYQFVTGGFLDGKFPTGGNCNSNGWFDIKVGVQFELGSNSGKWRRLIAK